MGKPEHWTGSDLGTRTEVIRYLKQRGGKLEDSSGLAAARIRDELGKGRALSQLLAEMETDGMIERDVRGRRTFEIRLVDDWGLATDTRPRLAAVEAVGKSVPVEPGTLTEDTDYERLAETLLAVVIRKANKPTADEGEMIRLRVENNKLQTAVEELKAAAAERDALADQVRIMEHNMQVLQAQLDKPRRGAGTTIRERLSASERNMLDRLMKTAPSTTKGSD